jgi:hypothetical protein
MTTICAIQSHENFNHRKKVLSNNVWDLNSKRWYLMTGDKENIRNITDNWDKFVKIDFTTHGKKQ